MYLHTRCRSSLAKVPTSYSRRRSSSRAVHTHFALFLPLFYLLGDNRNEQREQEVCALASDSERISQRARVPKHLWLVAIPSTTLSLLDRPLSLSPLSKLLFLFTPRRTPKNALDSSVVYSVSRQSDLYNDVFRNGRFLWRHVEDGLWKMGCK